MELQISTNDVLEAAFYEDEDETTDMELENERCGICMDVVIDRGVLDGCPHWFCFACIDNWATITNLCPLCKNEFQLITCLPVYDTIGSISSEDHLLSRNDDWCIEGRGNTLSFPSYYIDENAVKCLDGDACKIRSGISASDDDLTIDTSIACDSCDMWYHAFCVGFNHEFTSESSWLCPRCVADEAPQKVDDVLLKKLGKQSEFIRGADFGLSIESSFSEKVLVSIADAGETAVVVSMVKAKQNTEASTSLPLGCLDNNMDKEIETSQIDISTGNAKHDLWVDNSASVGHAQNNQISSNDTESDANPSTIQDCVGSFLDAVSHAAVSQDDIQRKSLLLPSSEVAPLEFTVTKRVSNQATPSNLKADGIIGEKHDEHCNLDGYMVFSPIRCDPLEPMSELSDNISVMNCPIASSSADNTVEGIHQKNMEANYLMNEQTEKSSDILSLDHANSQSGKRKRDLQVKTGTEDHVKKARSEEEPQIVPLRSQDCASAFDCTRRTRTSAALSECKFKSVLNKEDAASDIMNIVKENAHRSGSSVRTNTSDKSIEKTDNASGLRVKKIMRRVGDKRESSVLVEKLRKEIREVVQTSNVSCKDGFSGELLTAFRAAILKPQTEAVNRFDSSCLKTRKSLLQKGKTRESLTKKIYSTSNGRRKRAWDRDWEIEFWKHRCMITKPEKVETLQSVLDILKKVSGSCDENSEMDNGLEGDSKNTILSRVYLADASVFPRKDDIKPLSALGVYSVNNNNKDNRENSLNKVCGKDSQQVSENNMEKSSLGICKAPSQGKGPSSVNTGKIFSVPIIKKEVPHSQGNPEMDKRKWALEVLARKNSLASTDATKASHEDKSHLKGNYPLLAQLPADMIPVPAPSRHNKVSLSIRQTQLYRITEHYLRRKNLSAIRKTADTELAVADAVNVEKEIFERSNSKSVYMNLCALAVSQRADKPQTSKDFASDHAAVAESSSQVADKTFSDSAATSCSKVEEALMMAGLSDSPPSSPCRSVRNPHDKDADLVRAGDKGLLDVLDMDSHSKLDRDSVLGLEEGSVTTANVVGTPGALNLQPEDGDLGIKVVLPTPKCEKSEASQGSKKESSDKEFAASYLGNLKILNSSTGECQKESNIGTPLAVGMSDIVVQDPLQVELRKESSLAESEHPDGPDKEPSISRLYDGEKIDTVNVRDTDTVVKCTGINETEKSMPNEGGKMCELEIEKCTENCDSNRVPTCHGSSGGENSPARSLMRGSALEERSKKPNTKKSDSAHSISRKVEAYVKEHLRPLCKSGVITVEQYRWAVSKTTEKVMKYHYKAKNASFLIKEGAKVKRLAEEYAEAAQQRE